MDFLDMYEYTWDGEKVERTYTYHDGNTEIETANVTINTSEFSVKSVYTDPRKYDPRESLAAVKTLENALKTTDLYVTAYDYNW